MKSSGKIFFASDFHLGLKAGSEPVEREKKVVRWLQSIMPEAGEIFLLGDIFDFWWEYKHVVPKGFTRFFGTISEITDSGIPVHFFTGNHDMWTSGYLADECGMIIHTEPLTIAFNNKVFHLAHGEGLGSENTGYKILLSIFRNKTLRTLYSALHPSIGVGIGHAWSLNSRLGKGKKLEFLGEDNEDLIKYSRSVIAMGEKIDYFIYGHRHITLSYRIREGAEVIFLGDWVYDGSYAVWDSSKLILKDFD